MPLREKVRKGEMLLVEDAMTREVVTLTPQMTAAAALAVCRKRRIRHLPVLEAERLVGIVSDRDLRSAAPALGEPGRATTLERIQVRDVMTREVFTARSEDPIEAAANTMRERTIGCLPVVEGTDLVGIVTTSDVMGALVHLVGAHEPSSRLEVALPDRPDALAQIADILRDAGVNIVSFIAAPERGDGARVAVFRLDTIDPSSVASDLREAGFLAPWPPRT